MKPRTLWLGLLIAALFGCARPALAPSQADRTAPTWLPSLPIYDHTVIVVQGNNDYDQVIGSGAAPYINRLAAEGAILTRMSGEEHNSQGNYFWLFSENNQNVGFTDVVPIGKFGRSNLGAALIATGLTFKGYAPSLPAIGSDVNKLPPGCRRTC
jgi:phosphatidylinositol-3-phosphatase